MEKHYYHVCTKGTGVDLFLDEEDFRQIILIIALVFDKRFGIEVVSYSVLNNHLHIIVYGSLESIERQFIALKKMYSMWYAHKYGKSKVLARNPHMIRQCDDIEDLKNCIGYVYANPVKAGLCTNAFYYPWSSISAHFRDEWSTTKPEEGIKRLRGSAKKLHTHQPIPDYLRRNEKGRIDPASVVNTKLAESALRTSKTLMYFVTRKDAQITNSRETEFLCNDASARAKASEIVLQLCGKAISLNALPTNIRTKVADILRYNYGTPLPIIKRILG